MRKLIAGIGFFILASVAALPARAATIKYELNATPTDPLPYSYTYHLGGQFDAASMVNLLFGAGLYTNVSLDWSSLSGLGANWMALDGAIEPNAGVPADGILQLFALADTNEADATFRVGFDWSGPGRPGAQAFELIDSFGNLALTGTTTEFMPPVPGQVPEPATALLLMGGAGLLLGHLRRRPLS